MTCLNDVFPKRKQLNYENWAHPYKTKDMNALEKLKLKKLEDQYRAGKITLMDLVKRAYSIGVGDGSQQAFNQALDKWYESDDLEFSSWLFRGTRR